MPCLKEQQTCVRNACTTACTACWSSDTSCVSTVTSCNVTKPKGTDRENCIGLWGKLESPWKYVLIWYNKYYLVGSCNTFSESLKHLFYRLTFYLNWSCNNVRFSENTEMFYWLFISPSGVGINFCKQNNSRFCFKNELTLTISAWPLASLHFPVCGACRFCHLLEPTQL